MVTAGRWSMLIGNSLERNSMPGIGHGFRRSLVGLKPESGGTRRTPKIRFRRSLVGLKPSGAANWSRALLVSDGPSWG